MKKIAFCTQNMAPFRMKWMDEITKHYEVTVFHVSEYEKGVNSKYISYKSKKYNTIDISVKIGKYKLFNYNRIKDYNPDIIILDGYGFLAQQLLIIELAIAGKPFLFTFDGGIINYNEVFVKRIIKKFFISKGAAYFSTSQETDKYIDYYGGGGKKKYRHYFSSVTNDYLEKRALHKEEKKKIRQELGIYSEFSIISVGKFEHRKGFDLLIKAMENIDSDACVYFVGASDYSLYEQLLNEKNKDKIKFIEFCDQELLKKYYLCMDCMILPTRYDIWGLVITEAMANGLPVITTELCMAGVALLEPEELISVESIEDVEKSINTLMKKSDSEMEQIGNINIKKITKYTIENAVIEDLKSLESYYKEIVTSRRN